MSKPLRAAIGNTELLENYGYEPWDDSNIEHRCAEIYKTWTVRDAPECAALRQRMLRVHMECYPDDPRWR